MLHLSQRALSIKPSMTLTISATAKAMRAEGIPVLNFSAGEPDFDTPAAIRQAAAAAIEGGFTRYTAAGGIPELKAAIADKYRRDLGTAFGPEEILVSNGGKHALHSIFQAMVDPGDEVLVPAPYWLSYPDMVALSGGVPVVVPTRREDGYKLTPDALSTALGPRTRALILNSPSNPTGAVYTAAELTGLAAALRGRDIMVISDDVYEKFVFDGGRFTSVLSVAPDLRDQVVLINSASKTWAMPGWRMGWAVGPAPLIKAATAIQGQATSCPGSISQKALTAALGMDDALVDGFRASYESRRDLMVAGLETIAGLSADRPQGAFYLLADVSALMDRVAPLEGSVGFCQYLLEQCRIAAIPGAAFGADDCIRLSFVAPEADIREGITRLQQQFAH